MSKPESFQPEFSIVHIGDVHLRQGPRQADRLAALDQAIAIGLAQSRLGAWILPGDAFDARSDIESRNALKDRAKVMADAAPLAICYGNHDAPGDLDIFGDLRTKYPIHISNIPEVYSLDVAGKFASLAVFAVPYPTEAGLVSRGVAPGAIPQTARDILQTIFIDAAAKIDDAERLGAAPLMIGHINVAGARTSSPGQPPIGQEIELDQALLALLPAGCYKGLNHIHYGQEVGGAWYPGSICRLSWGEVEPKRVLVIDYARRRIDVSSKGDPGAWIPGRGWDYQVRSVPLAVPPMWHVQARMVRVTTEIPVGNDGSLFQDAEAWLQDFRVTAGPDGEAQTAPDSWDGQDVRMRLEYRQSEGKVLERGLSMVKAMFAGARRFELEPICIPDRALRAPEVAAAATLPEKLAAWARVSGVVLSDQAGSCAATLETSPDPEAYAAQYERQLAALVDLSKPEVSA